MKLDMKTVCKWSIHWWNPSNHRWKNRIFCYLSTATGSTVCISLCAQLAKYLSLLEVREQSMWEGLDALTFFYYPTVTIQTPPFNLTRSFECVSFCSSDRGHDPGKYSWFLDYAVGLYLVPCRLMHFETNLSASDQFQTETTLQCLRHCCGSVLKPGGSRWTEVKERPCLLQSCIVGVSSWNHMVSTRQIRPLSLLHVCVKHHGAWSQLKSFLNQKHKWIVILR